MNLNVKKIHAIIKKVSLLYIFVCLMIFLGQEPTTEEKAITPKEQGMAQEDGNTKAQTTPQNDNNADEDFLQSTPQHVGPTQRRKLTK